MKRKIILEDYIEILKNRFFEEQELEIIPAYIGNVNIDGHVDIFMDCYCSKIECESFQNLCFDPAKDKFFYLGNSQMVNGNITTFFFLNKALINSLPIDLVEGLRRVGKTGIPETFIFPTNELTDNLEDD